MLRSVSSPPEIEPSTADLLLINPSAGGGAAHASVGRLREFAERRGWRVEPRITTSAAELTQLAKEGSCEGRRRIFALGGDGTFQDLANAVGPHSEVVIGVLPAGGGNDLAQALGLPNDPLQAAELLLSGAPQRIDAVRYMAADGHTRLYLGGGGLGLDARAAEFANTSYRRLRGRVRYIAAALHALAGFHPLRVRATLDFEDTRELDVEALVLGVLNTPSYGGGVKLAPGAKIDDGKLDVVLVKPLSLWEIARALPGLALHGELRSSQVERWQAVRVKIHAQEGTMFHGDGELLGCTPITVEVVPGAFRVQAPAAG